MNPRLSFLAAFVWAAAGWLLTPVALWAATAAGSAFDAPGQAATFVANQECRTCHTEAFDAWSGSHHDRAMEIAGPATVLGDFNDAQFSHDGEVMRFSREGQAYFVEITGASGDSQRLAVKYTFGVEPLQQYLVDTGAGRLQALTVAWDTSAQRWFGLNPGIAVQAGDALHWNGVYQSWNATCAECHSTNLVTGFDAAAERHSTTFSEVDVSCQACHGPGSRHIAWARSVGVSSATSTVPAGERKSASAAAQADHPEGTSASAAEPVARGAGAGADAGGTGADAGGTGADAGGTGADAGGTGADAGGTGADAGGTGADAGGTGADAGGTGADASGAGAGSHGLIVGFRGQSAAHQVAQCARCHARRARVSVDDAHGRDLLDDFVPALLRPGLYYPDGQIQDEVYVYGSFLQSKMFAAGVRCTDCHEPHSLTLEAQGNELCSRCHQASPDPRFSGLQARSYDTPAHHFHRQGSPGAQCVNCHMPARTYMIVDPRRDHSFRVPRPDLSVSLKVPNACTNCHDDRDPQWAAAQIDQRHGTAWRKPHYGEVFAQAQSGAPAAGTGLVALAQDPDTPAIVRATALEHLGQFERVGAKALALGLSDPDPLVRIGALRGIEALPARVRVTGALNALDDPVRGVRVEAARLLSPYPPGDLPQSVLTTHERAAGEHREALLAQADRPGGRFGLALLAEAGGDAPAAEAEYRKALALDRHFGPARFNLVRLLNREQRNAEAEVLLREGTELLPDEGEMHYSLGLLLGEGGDLAGAAEAFARAAELMPERPRVHYNLGLALGQLQRPAQSATALLRAAALAPDDIDIAYALALHFEAQRNWAQAQFYAQRLVQLTRGSAQARQLLERYRALSRYGKS